MAINNLMPPVQLRKPAAPVTDINKMIEDLNLQLTTPTVQQAAPQSANSIAELLKQQIAEKLNQKIEALTQGVPLEEVTGQKTAPPPQSNLSRLRDESPIHGSTSAGTTAFAKTAQMMNNLKATNEAINQDREYKQYRDEVDINKMIERLDLQNQYARALESDRAQNRMTAQDAAFEDKMALLNARLEAKGSGKGAGRPAGSGAAVTGDLNKLEAFLIENGMTPDELAVLTTKQKQAKAAYYAGRPEKTVNREEYLRKKASLEQAINAKKMYGETPTAEELELLEIYKTALSGPANKTGGTEPAKSGASRANELLMKGSLGKASAPAENQSATTPVLTTDDIIKIINATQGNMPNNPKIKFDPKKY